MKKTRGNKKDSKKLKEQQTTSDQEGADWLLLLNQFKWLKRQADEKNKNKFRTSLAEKAEGEIKISRKISQPEEIKQTVKRELKKSGLERIVNNPEIHDYWENIVGLEIAGKTRVLAYNKGILQIEVFSAALLSELRGFLKTDLLTALREVFPGHLPLIDIKFKAGSR